MVFESWDLQAEAESHSGGGDRREGVKKQPVMLFYFCDLKAKLGRPSGQQPTLQRLCLCDIRCSILVKAGTGVEPVARAVSWSAFVQ